MRKARRFFTTVVSATSVIFVSSVIVELVIDPKGNVGEATAVKSVPELDEAALKAARKWKFEPTLIAANRDRRVVT